MFDIRGVDFQNAFGLKLIIFRKRERKYIRKIRKLCALNNNISISRMWNVKQNCWTNAFYFFLVKRHNALRNVYVVSAHKLTVKKMLSKYFKIAYNINLSTLNTMPS